MSADLLERLDSWACALMSHPDEVEHVLLLREAFACISDAINAAARARLLLDATEGHEDSDNHNINEAVQILEGIERGEAAK